ncbi:electron transfer flavoprotein subunit alpha [Photobacterium ganghwense]|uniref:Electron transfer flavoprotein subunit alpha n=1 Tax=Photobacterium ganghwense TaxID=320778 RepID=A0A0J1H835_9GAMM|nr:FAD-binding protein [Photobacterium ganghwense]KLV07870.1 electron transfer flavoprotein subunit beta [Photobacterium ganghwense]PSU06968.1 electron transfer flavoprotein subunit alpha [Photobacterium ganghwense]QSV15720.1 FAD-binding protein [Photobacterium ganghwense]
MAVLLIAEHDNQVLGHDTLKAMGAAGSLSGGIDVLVAGVHCQKVAEQASRIAGVQRVLVADSTVYEHQLAENLSALVAEIGGKYTHIVAASTTFGKNLLPRVAALLDVGMLSDVIAIESDDTVVRPIYAGNALARVKSNDAVKILTVRGSAFDTASERSEGMAEIASLDIEIANDVSRFAGRESANSARPELSAARIVVSGGRGLGNKENFALIEKLADKLGAAIGASRAAVDAGFVSNDLQVGQTGKIVAPDLYIAVGISGAIQHLAGMKDSKVIVAINSDPEAPIFDIADYGLVGDLFEILPQLIDAV